MSDFIFSKNMLNQHEISEMLQSIYTKDKPTIQEFHGEWGSFGLSKNLYNGFNSYEDGEFIVAVIGGPILMFRDNSFLDDTDSSEGTIAILHRWLMGKMKWEDDLSGPFVIVIINKITNEIYCVTDLMSFIPVYAFQSSKSIVLSTHIDILARITNQFDNVDLISEVDFILHGIVTYPYTFYKQIFQIAPASEHNIINNLFKLKSNSYWVPREILTDSSVNKTAIQLRNSLMTYIDRVVCETSNVAQFISGGEDSRTLSAMLKKYERDAIIFLDYMNREGKTAEKVASTFGANFKLYTRENLHYLNILQSCSQLVGSGSQYHHAHTYGFHQISKLDSYSAVFGGLFSDALFKGSRIKKIRKTGKFPLVPEMKNMSYSISDSLKSSLINKDVLKKLKDRRKSHLEYIRNFRTQSSEEWFELWPSSMNFNIPNLHANRRLFRSYEPFMSNEVVKLSATIPQDWKLNRKLFHKMAKPLLKPTKFLKHGNGWYPYYSWKINSIVFPLLYIVRKVGKRIGISKRNQGSWGEWSVITTSNEWLNAIEEYTLGFELLQPVVKELDINKAIQNRELSTYQRVNFLQTLYINSKKYNNQ